MTDIEKAISILDLLPKLMASKRQMLRLTLREVAEQVGVNYGTLSRMERGDNATLKNAVLVLKWIDTPPPGVSPDSADLTPSASPTEMGRHSGDERTTT